jgi:hypothetical protein
MTYQNRRILRWTVYQKIRIVPLMLHQVMLQQAFRKEHGQQGMLFFVQWLGLAASVGGAWPSGKHGQIEKDFTHRFSGMTERKASRSYPIFPQHPDLHGVSQDRVSHNRDRQQRPIL